MLEEVERLQRETARLRDQIETLSGFRKQTATGSAFVRERDGAVWLLGHREKGWAAFGFRFESWEELARHNPDLRPVGCGGDEHGPFIEMRSMAARWGSDGQREGRKKRMTRKELLDAYAKLYQERERRMRRIEAAELVVVDVELQERLGVDPEIAASALGTLRALLENTRQELSRLFDEIESDHGRGNDRRRRFYRSAGPSKRGLRLVRGGHRPVRARGRHRHDAQPARDQWLKDNQELLEYAESQRPSAQRRSPVDSVRS